MEVNHHGHNGPVGFAALPASPFSHWPEALWCHSRAARSKHAASAPVAPSSGLLWERARVFQGVCDVCRSFSRTARWTEWKGMRAGPAGHLWMRTAGLHGPPLSLSLSLPGGCPCHRGYRRRARYPRLPCFPAFVTSGESNLTDPVTRAQDSPLPSRITTQGNFPCLENFIS